MPQAKSPIEDVITVAKDNLLVQYAVVVPLVGLFAWLFGFYYMWGSLLVCAIGYSIRVVAHRKGKFYEDFVTERNLTHNKREVQNVAWINLIVRKYWCSCVPKFVEPAIADVNKQLEEKKPGFIKKLEVSEWKLGDRAPRITQMYTPIILNDDRYEVQFEMEFVPDLRIQVDVQAAVAMKVVASEIKYRGRMKVVLDLNNLFPECSIVSVSFIENPLLELSIRPVGAVDALSLPFVYELLKEVVKSQLDPILIFPNQLQLTLGGGPVETFENMKKPITDIIIICSETAKAPPGYILLQRTASGVLPANLNTGNKGKQLFICYSRDETKAPITGLSIFYPSLGEKPPTGFETILETPSAESASMNSGNKGIECFLAFTREEGQPPVTGLTLINEGEDYIMPEDFRILELSPEGHKANVNKKTRGDRLFIAFKGGVHNYFGFHKPCVDPDSGLLRVCVKEAKNLVGADLGGTSDPFVELVVGEKEPKSGSPKKLTSVIDKTCDPLWNEHFVFKVDRKSTILTANVYDKDKLVTTLLGRVQLRLDELVMDEEVDQWIPVQLEKKGELHLQITALDFGLPSDGARDLEAGSRSVTPIDPVSNYNSVSLLGAISGIGGLGIKGVKGVAGFGGDIAGMGLKGVTDVGGLGADIAGKGLKGVTDVGELGIKGVTDIGSGVADLGGNLVGGITGGLFGKKKKTPRGEKSETEKSEKKSKGMFGFGGKKDSSSADLKSTETEDQATLEESEKSTGPKSPVNHEGKLEKIYGVGGMMKKTRFCTIDEKAFIIYKSSKDRPSKPHETILLSESSLKSDVEDRSFVIHHGDEKPDEFKCASAADFHQWVSAITNNIELAK